MAIDRTQFPETARLLLLEDFERRTEGWRDDVEEKVDRVISKVDVLGAKLGVYAAVGACVGAAVVTAVVTAILHL